MREFFKEWRRKVGLLTLLMACVFMAGWVRSHVIQDQFLFSTDGHSLSRFFPLSQ